MIHIVCYLRGGDPGREGRELWSYAWPPCTAVGLIRWPACLSVWNSGSHPPLVVLVASLFITFLSSTSTPPPLFSCPLPSLLISHLSLISPLPFFLLFLLLLTTTLLLLLVSRVRLRTEFFITSHLLPARAKERCHQRHRQRAQLLT